MAEIEKLTSDERELLLGACLGSDYLDNAEFVAIRDVMAKALGIVDAQAVHPHDTGTASRVSASFAWDENPSYHCH